MAKENTRYKINIKQKIILIVSLVALALFFLSFVLGYFRGFKLLISTISQKHYEILNILNDYINERIDRKIINIKAVLTDPGIIEAIKKNNLRYQDLDSEGARKYLLDIDKEWKQSTEDNLLFKEYLDNIAASFLRSYCKEDKVVSEILITDRFGGLVAASNKPNNFYQADSAWWQKAFNNDRGRLFIGDVEFGQSSHAVNIAFFIPIKDDANKIIGIVRAVINTRNLFEALGNFRIGKTGHVVLLDTKGRAIIHSNLSLADGAFFNEWDFKRLTENKHKWSILNSALGHQGKIFIVSREVKNPILESEGIIWRVFIDEDLKELFIPLAILAYDALKVFIVLIIIIILLWYLLERILVVPIKSLRMAAEKVSLGDWDYKIDIKTGDEIECLANTLSDMAQNLKEKEEELLSQKAYSDNLISSMTESFIVSAADNTIKYVNSATLNLLGYKEEELIGRPIDNIFSLEDGTVHKYLNRVLEEGTLRNLEVICVTKQGEKIPVDFNSSVVRQISCPHYAKPIKDCPKFEKIGMHCKKIVGIATIAYDLRPIKSLVGALDKSRLSLEERTRELTRIQRSMLNIMEDLEEAKNITAKDKFKMEAMIEAVTVGVVMLDIEGKFMMLNNAARQILGFKVDDKISTDILRERMKVISLGGVIEECQNNQRLISKEIVLPHREKTQIVHCDVFFAKDNEGIHVGIVAVLRDITKDKEIELMKSEFVSTVSHELRTPLAIIKEGVDLVLDGITGQINEKQAKVLSSSKNNIDRLARIINGLLDISKIEAGKLELKREVVNIVDIVKEVALSFESKIKQKGLELRMDLSKDNIEIYADRDKMIQILTNLIGNALKFTLKGFIKVSVWEGENRVECSVTDSGVGISEEDFSRIFNKFQQFSRHPGTGDKGTGLGLSITKGLIGLHTGKIWVESELDKGSKFTFSLPKYSSEQIFKEYVHSGIRDAIKNNTKMSLIMYSISNYQQIEQEISRSILKDLEKVFLDTLRRKGDTIVMNSKEMMVILSGCEKENALKIVIRLEAAINNYFVLKGLKNKVRWHISLAVFPDEAIDVEGLLDKVRGV